ncbi:uncharacterized protein V6R79_019709 [Siganus canaliculatus]
MSPHASARWEGSMNSSSLPCDNNMTSWEQQMDQMYTYFYLLLFIPGLLLNTTALWVLCRHISKKTKAVIFMINLALADLAHILSLPFRIHYYFTHDWPFGRSICLFCFYLKYLNMYAAIVFLVCISVQRCVFLLDPFSARRWRRRYDLLISVLVWVVVGLSCSPFIIMRSSSSPSGTQEVQNLSYLLQAAPTQHSDTRFSSPSLSSVPSGSRLTSSPSSSSHSCFKDLPMRPLPTSLAVTMMTLAELFGFVIPLICVSYSSIRITRSLNRKQNEEQHDPTALNSTARARLQSVTSNGGQTTERSAEKQSEKRRALRIVLGCTALFLFCFAPYHINFMLYLMVSQGIVTHCATVRAVRQFHPVSLCMASLSCCLNPLLYYFLNAEFRQHLTVRTSSFTSSLLSSPISTRERPAQRRLISMESSCSY